MTPRWFMEGGLERILSVLADRYEIDASGRITRDRRNDGRPPRFVLGRAAEGCVWRFGVHVDPARIRAAARLAAREPGIPDAGNCPPQPPERLLMIERVFAEGDEVPSARREVLHLDDVGSVELWTLA